MAIIRVRRPLFFYLTIGLVSVFGFLFVAHEHHLAVKRATSKVISWIGLRFKNYNDEPTAPIYFTETSSKPYVEAREACSIESAALHHPDSNVTLYSIGILLPNNPYVTVLRNMSNVHLKPLNLSELFRGTPLDEWHNQGLIQDSYYPIEHLSDAVRLALLWKNGGIYLDTDVIVIRSFRGVRNAVALQEKEEANGAILVFDRKSAFVAKCMDDYVEHFSAGEWDKQGPALITRNLKDACGTDVLRDAVNDPSACDGVTLLTADAFYPVPWPDWNKLFEPADDVDLDLTNSYTVHLWGKLSRNKVATPGNNSILENLAFNNCPLVYEIMKKNQAI